MCWNWDREPDSLVYWFVKCANRKRLISAMEMEKCWNACDKMFETILVRMKRRSVSLLNQTIDTIKSILITSTLIIGVIDIDWHSVGDSEYCTDLFLNIARPDLIVASDIVYDNTLFRPLCQTIDYIFKQCQNKCRMILANAVRNEDTQMEFLSMLGRFIIIINCTIIIIVVCWRSCCRTGLHLK